MKNSFLLLILGMFLFAQPAHAAYAPVAPVVVGGGASGGPAFFPFAGAVGASLLVLYLNAEGVPFPLCGDNWMNSPQTGTKCYGEYPEPVHKDGV